MRKNQKGFSLIELLIVVAIILIIAALAVPQLLSARAAANEAAAVGAVRALDQACVTYTDAYNIGYPAALANLGPAATPSAAAADLIDQNLANGLKSGYNFIYVAGAADANGYINSFTVNANPASSSSGVRYFYLDQNEVITYAYGAAASSTDQPL
ncbi:MAG: prepilin-type N-terminal cleavage/methylation domain-containing protein [Candidatus Acidiferrales bacterium]